LYTFTKIHLQIHLLLPICSIPVAVDMPRLFSVLAMTLGRSGEMKTVFALLDKESFAWTLLRLIVATCAPAQIGSKRQEGFTLYLLFVVCLFVFASTFPSCVVSPMKGVPSRVSISARLTGCAFVCHKFSINLYFSSYF